MADLVDLAHVRELLAAATNGGDWIALADGAYYPDSNDDHWFVDFRTEEAYGTYNGDGEWKQPKADAALIAAAPALLLRLVEESEQLRARLAVLENPVVNTDDSRARE